MAGFNRYLGEVGIGRLPRACLDPAWARPMIIPDFHRLMELAMVQAGAHCSPTRYSPHVASVVAADAPSME